MFAHFNVARWMGGASDTFRSIHWYGLEWYDLLTAGVELWMLTVGSAEVGRDRGCPRTWSLRVQMRSYIRLEQRHFIILFVIFSPHLPFIIHTFAIALNPVYDVTLRCHLMPNHVLPYFLYIEESMLSISRIFFRPPLLGLDNFSLPLFLLYETNICCFCVPTEDLIRFFDCWCLGGLIMNLWTMMDRVPYTRRKTEWGDPDRWTRNKK